MGVYGALYGEARDPTITSVCDVVCDALTLPLTLLALFLILSIFLHGVTQKKRL